jgi:uncharacterized RDD family membrane protein YckC
VYCSKCGNSLAEGATFCANCGQAALVGAAPISGAGFASTPQLAAGAIAQSPVVVLPPGTAVFANGTIVRVSYAGFWLRFVAHLIDNVILGILCVLSFIVFLLISGVGAALSNIRPGEDFSDVMALFGIGAVIGYVILVICGIWLYFAYSESSGWQATPGKKMLGLRVTDLSAQRISFSRATGRFFGKIISGLIPFAIGYIIAGFTEKRQALHDMIAGCLVLRND